MEKKRSLEEIDEFWSLDDLLPQKKQTSARRNINTDTVEIELPDNNDNSPSSRFGGAPLPPRTEDTTTQSPTAQSSVPTILRSPRDEARRLRELPMRTKAAQNEQHPLEPYLIYEPDSPIVRRVSVAKWQTRYTFYERFRIDAHRYWERTARDCDPVSFFSYIPQYNQLSYAQLKWYLCWRTKVREGSYPNTDYSYILLYIYEIINCPELVPPERGLELLCDILLAYRSRYPRIDSYLGEWICDYCLINRLPCPTERLEAISQALVTAVSFKEFYMDSPKRQLGAASVLAFSSNYDWRTSRYVTRENLPVFSRHIDAAFEKTYREILSDDENGEQVKRATIVRDAYSGALCIWDMKRSITVEYMSYTRSPKFRFVVTDIIKYSENRVRMALGIKARLKVENLTEPMKRCLDGYFDANLPIKRADKPKKPESVPIPDYEHFYEPTSTSLSLERALEIEQSSWSTTEILTSALGDGSTPATDASADVPRTSVEPEPMPGSTAATDASADVPRTSVEPEPISGSTTATDASEADEYALLIASLDPICVDAIRALLAGKSDALIAAAEKLGSLADALADRINEAAFDITGDSIIEPDGVGYAIIPDYKGELLKCLS